jgi:murein DD-endopeptidase MepM/ murein hydrolase activator NlpD
MGSGGFYIDNDELNLYLTEKGDNKKRRLIIGGSGVSIILGILFAIYFLKFFNSPAEKQLRNEIETYRTKYSIVNAQLSKLAEHIEYFEEKDNQTYRVIFELPAISDEKRFNGVGGPEIEATADLSQLTLLSANSLEKIDLLMHRMEVQEKSFEELMKAALSKEKMLASLPTIMPVAKERIRITSLFGWRPNPFRRSVFSFHAGVDFAGRVGTPIYATGDGVVISPNSGMSGYGRVVVINHGYSYKTLYAHLQRAIVKPGDRVKRGQIIGYLGNTGSSTGPHLHYEVIKGGQSVNPMNYIYSSLTREEFNEILQQAELQ